MPNWGDNKLRVYCGDDDAALVQLQDFEYRVQDHVSDFSLQALHPCPQQLLATESPATDEIAKKNHEAFGHPDWFSWCTHNWGTKWDVHGKLMNRGSPDDLERIYRFKSASFPPLDWLVFVSRMFPLLEFHLRYEEDDSRLKQAIHFANGKLTEIKTDWESPL